MYKEFFGLEDTPFTLTPDPRFIVFARKLALLGLSHAEIAKNLGADRHTFNKWRHLARRRAIEGLLGLCAGRRHWDARD